MNRLLLALVLLLTLGRLSSAQTHTEVTLEDNQLVVGQKTFSPGATLGPVLFINLTITPSQANGTIVGVIDGSPTNPCTGGGTGAIAQRINGVWNCAGSGGGGSGNVLPVAKASLAGSGDVGISGAIATLAGGRGIVWADYSVNQVWSSCPTWGNGTIQLLLYPVQYSVGVNCTIPSNVTINHANGGQLCPVTGTTLTIQGNIQAPEAQIFCNIASGQGSLSFAGNRVTKTYSPLWFGIDCTAVADNAPIWNQIVSFVTDDVTFVVPNNCSQNIGSTITVSSRAGFKVMSMDRAQNGGGNQRPIMNWTGNGTGGIFNFIANQAPTIEGFLFTNCGTCHLDYFLQFDGNPAARIGTEAMVRYNTFTNNMTNPTVGGSGTFDAIRINIVSGQNHEKNVVTDNDFFCSQSRNFRESDSTQINNGSATVTCGLGNCAYTTDASIGDRIRVSFATGIFDSTVSSITDNNHLQAAATFSGTSQTGARLTFRQAYGNGISIGSANAKHNTLDRNSFTQCARGINMTNGSFSLEHIGGSANDVLIYINNASEATELSYVEDEQTMRDVYLGNVDAVITLNHIRNSLAFSGEFDGFIYIATAARVNVENSVLQDTPAANSVVFGIPSPGTTEIVSIGNTWGPGVATMSNLGFSQMRTQTEGALISGGFLISCGDFDITDVPGECFQFGDGGQYTNGTNEGHVIAGAGHFGNFPSFNMFTAEPNVQVNTFVNEARGFRTVFNAFNNSQTMAWIGFDTVFKTSINVGASSVGYRYTMPTVTGVPAAPFARGLWVAAPAANTNITTGAGVYVEDLTTHTGIANRYSFFGVGATDIAHFGGTVELGSQNTLYNNIATAGTGLAPNYGTPINLTGQVANLGATTIYTTTASPPGGVGLYRVCVTTWTTVTGNTTALQANIVANNGAGASTTPVGPVLNTSALTNAAGGTCTAVHVAASQAIQVSTTGYNTTGTYSIQATAEQLF
jgi:hypothetical protein